MKLIRFLTLTAAALAVLCGLATDTHADSLASIFTNVQPKIVSARRTSIIVIRCHGLAYGDLSCYGQTNYLTPNIDRMANEGMRFTNFHLDGDFDSALAAFMTGQHDGFPLGSETIGDRLKQAGYRTGFIGEWTLTGQPWHHGFDDFAGFINDDEGRNYYSDHIWRYAPRSIYNPTNNSITDWQGSEELYPNTAGKKGMYLPEVLANATWRFAQDHVPDRFNRFQPFFLVADYSAPRSAVKGADEFPVPSDAPYSDAPWPQAAKNRAALLTRLDGGIGQLLDVLNHHGMTNNVVIFLTSSAPPEKFAGANMAFLKTDGPAASLEPTQRPSPMIAYWPASIPAAKVSAVQWSDVDFMPTLLEIAEAPPASKTAGVSLFPVLIGETNSVERSH